MFGETSNKKKKKGARGWNKKQDFIEELASHAYF